MKRMIFCFFFLMIFLSTPALVFAGAGGSGGGSAPELPMGALSILIGVGAAAIAGSKLLKKKNKNDK